MTLRAFMQLGAYVPGRYPSLDRHRPKREALMAAECARADIRDERRVWHVPRQPRMRQQPHRLVFLDETYVNTKMTRLRGRSRKGQRLRTARPLRPLEDAHLHRRAALS